MSGSLKFTFLVGLAVASFYSAASSAAHATEGPYFEVSGTRLAAGATRAITGTEETKSQIIKFGTVALTCVQVVTSSSPGASAILGSSGANAGTASMVFEISGCTVTGNGTPCSLAEPFVSSVVSTLAYPSTSRSGSILELYTPASGKKFGTFVFIGSACEFTSATVEGSIAAEVWSGGNDVEVGKEPADTAIGELNFPASLIKKAWTESAGVLTEHTVSFKVFGIASSVEGRLKMELSGSPAWGMHTR
jgi:hypothetical protein